MTVDKMSVSLLPALSASVREAAEESGETLSGWLADAAQRKLRSEALDDFLSEWEEENGTITEEEIAHATTKFGMSRWTSPRATLVKVVLTEEKGEAVVSALARIVRSGQPIFVLEQNLVDFQELATSSDRVVVEGSFTSLPSSNS